ncbi:fasciclin-like arabinogalactan protein 13 [Malania oleifera]|uniref:fasciclin-like arabinogalactan protein 13 n=1 Tax=Malania oleifera TaxID=397392 RepID=UPI0025ADD0F3|nr:fasciclin-like arabinogalactan protein 13 [Malania oleifera]
MASPSLPLILPLLTLSLLLAFSQNQAKTASAPAPAASGTVNLTGILDKNGQYTSFIRLLTSTQVADQIDNQVNTSTEGFTVLAPTDNAFANLKAGALNGLNDQQKVQLVLYHVLPKYYSLVDFQTVSNPVRTQAGGQDGSWGLNFIAQSNQINVSTGVVDTPLNNVLRQAKPLAVYQVDKVLLPEELFGNKTSTPAPAPVKSTPSRGSNSSSSSTPKQPSPSENGSSRARSVGLSLVALVVGLIYAVVLL